MNSPASPDKPAQPSDTTEAHPANEASTASPSSATNPVTPPGLDVAKKILDDSAEKNRNLFIALNVFFATVLVLTLSITDLQLLTLQLPISLPALNVGLPLRVYAWVAAVFVLCLHFVLLYNLAEHRDKLHTWMQASTDPSGRVQAKTTELFPSLFDFAYLRWHTHRGGAQPAADAGAAPAGASLNAVPNAVPQAKPSAGLGLVAISWWTYGLLPLLVLLCLFVKFASLQEWSVTLFHLAVLVLDALLLSRYWHQQGFWKADKALPRWLVGWAQVLPLAMMVFYGLWMLGTFVAVHWAVQFGPLNKKGFDESVLVWLERHEPDFIKLLPRLQVPRQRITQLNEDFFKLYAVVPQTQGLYKDRKFDELLNALNVAPPPDLSGRHFAFANFERSELQGLNIEGAVFYGTRLNQADLRMVLGAPQYTQWRFVQGDFVQGDFVHGNAQERKLASEQILFRDDVQRRDGIALASGEFEYASKAPDAANPAQTGAHKTEDGQPVQRNTGQPSEPRPVADKNATPPEKAPSGKAQPDLGQRPRYELLAAGAQVLDTQTRLIWQRCSVGQQWNGRTCEGQAKIFTFDEAQKLPLQAAYASWRVPTVRELFSLVQCSSGRIGEYSTDVGDKAGKLKNGCLGDYSRPTLNTVVFPDTPTLSYGSSTQFDSSGLPDMLSLPLKLRPASVGVYFGDGSVGAIYSAGDAKGFLVRLVRSAL